MVLYTHGIDVSHYQGIIQWDKVKASGCDFAITKATDGTEFIDPKLVYNWDGMSAAGLIRGAYHFFRPEDDPVAQARHFNSVVNLENTDLPPIVDVEVTDGVSSEGIFSVLQKYTQEIKSLTGRVHQIIYISPSFANTYLDNQFGAYPLWVANYREGQPKLPNAWDTWTFWQYTSSGQVDGVNGSVDCDYYNGSLEDLRSFVASSVQG